MRGFARSIQAIFGPCFDLLDRVLTSNVNWNEMLGWSAKVYPRIEFVWLKNINFYPGPPENLAELGCICIGTKCRNIGDALMNTALPGLLKQKFPKLKVYTYPRAFNPIVFHMNPHVDGIQYLPDSVFGDDCSLGVGHLMQRKERFFGLEVSERPKPEIFLSKSERELGLDFLIQECSGLDFARQSLPLCILHPWGHTYKQVLSGGVWNSVVQTFKSQWRFVQVGMPGHTRIEGCDGYLWGGGSIWSSRQLFSVLSQSQSLLGVNSAPMHIARAFGIPSQIFVDHSLDWNSPKMDGFLYRENFHVAVENLTHVQILDQVEKFFQYKNQEL